MELADYVFPKWALAYLINSNPSGLEDAEIQEVDDFIDNEMERNCYDSFVVTMPDDEHYFSYYNDINGLGTNVYECKVIVNH